MKTRILAIILSVCLVGALAWGFTNYKEVGELKQAEMVLQRTIAEQGQKLNQALSDADWLDEELRECSQANFELEQEIGYLKEGLQYCGEENDLLEKQVRSLSEIVEQRGIAYNDLQESLEKWKAAYNDLQESLEKWKAAYNDLQAQMEDIDYLQYLLQLLL